MGTRSERWRRTGKAEGGGAWVATGRQGTGGARMVRVGAGRSARPVGARRKGGTRPVGRTGGRRGVALGRPPAGSPDAENPRHPDESGLPGVPTTGERRAVRFGASSVDAAGLPSPSFPRRAVCGSGAPGPGARSAAASDLAAGSPGTEPSRRARPPKGVPFGGPAPPVRGPLDRRRVRHTIVRQGGRRKDLVDNCKLVQHSNIRRPPSRTPIPAPRTFAQSAPAPALARL